MTGTCLDPGDSFHFPVFQDCPGWFRVQDGTTMHDVHYNEMKDEWTCTCEDATLFMGIGRPVSCPHVRYVKKLLKGE